MIVGVVGGGLPDGEASARLPVAARVVGAGCHRAVKEQVPRPRRCTASPLTVQTLVRIGRDREARCRRRWSSTVAVKLPPKVPLVGRFDMATVGCRLPDGEGLRSGVVDAEVSLVAAGTWQSVGARAEHPASLVVSGQFGDRLSVQTLGVLGRDRRCASALSVMTVAAKRTTVPVAGGTSVIVTTVGDCCPGGRRTPEWEQQDTAAGGHRDALAISRRSASQRVQRTRPPSKSEK